MKSKKSAQAIKLWERGSSIEGTLAQIYLERRKLSAAGHLDGSLLRYLPDVSFRIETVLAQLPALLTLMRNPVTGEPCGVQRTPLNSSGEKHKIGRRMLGVSGVAMIAPDDQVTDGLIICEGLETGLACEMMGYSPVWACMSADGLTKFPLLSGIEAVTIFADADANNAGLNAAQSVYRRYVAAGREATVMGHQAGDLADLAEEIRYG